MYVQNYSNNSIQANKTPAFCLLLTEKKQKTKGKIEQRRGKTKEYRRLFARRHVILTPCYIYAYEFRYYSSDFRAKMPRLSKRTPFGLQKGSFCTAKGVLLHSKRTTFGGQKDSF